MKTYSIIYIGGIVLALALQGCASSGRPASVKTQNVQDAVVTVESIDVPNRMVTVRDSSGVPSTFYVDESLKTFPQARVGDQVRIRFTESMAYKVVAPSRSGSQVKVEESTARPQPGVPSGSTSSEVVATVRIESVHQNGSLVTFVGPRGRRTVQITDRNLRDYTAKLKPGDHVEVTYREAVAVELEPIAGNKG